MRMALEDVARGRRRTTTNAILLTVSIGVRLHLARRGVMQAAILTRIAGMETEWLALLPTIDRYRDLDGPSPW